MERGLGDSVQAAKKRNKINEIENRKKKFTDLA